MLRKTHVSIGIATALAVIRPTSVASCFFALIGGAIGGWLPDIDLNSRKKINGSDDSDDDYTDYIKDGVYYDPEEYGEVGNDHPGLFHDNEITQSTIQLVLLVGISLLLDLYFKNGICEYFVETFGIKTIIGIIALIALIIFGIHTNHRTFTHSLLGCALFCLSVWLIAEPFGIAFLCGFAAHIIIDVLNRKPGNQYFWPANPRIYLNLVPSDGKFNTVLGNIGVIASIYLFFYFLVPCLISNPRMIDLLATIKSPALKSGNISFSGLAVYLIAINIVSFIAFTMESLIYRYSFTWQYSDDDSAFVLTTLHILAYAGGGLGMLIFVLIVSKGHISKASETNNTTLYLVPIVSILLWIILSFMIINPFNINLKSFQVFENISLQYLLIIYFSIINLITFILVMFQNSKNRDFTAAEITTLILALFGGATGGYFAMGISNRKMTVHHFTFGMPLMMMIHAIVLSLIYHLTNKV